MPALETIEADAVSFFTWLEGFAANQHQRTEDAGFAALARLAGKFGAVLTDPANAADIAAAKALAVQSFPSLTAPAKLAPQLQDPPSSESPSADFSISVGGHPSASDSGLMRGE